MKKIQRKFSSEFKSKVALELIKGTDSMSVICSRYKIHPTQARLWKEQAVAGLEVSFTDKRSDDLKAKNELIDELYKQIGQLTVERDWLKKRCRQALDERKKLINPNHPELSIKRQCELLGINRSSFYYQAKPEDSLNLELMNKIDALYTDRPCEGAVKITDNLNRQGYQINHKRIERLMRVMGIQAIYPKKRTSKAHPDHKTYPYLLRNVIADHPNHIWGADITYIGLATGWAYLAVILDWYSRYVISWRLSSTMESSFCIEALAEALAVNIPEISNTDQGAQFTDKKYVGLLEEKGIAISMDGRGRCFDNIFTERLWRTVKYEEVYLNEYQNIIEAQQSLQRYFHSYNYQRLYKSLVHPDSGLKFQTPAEVYYQQPFQRSNLITTRKPQSVAI